MLYQTHHLLFFQFRSTFPLSSSFQEMECVEAALKTSFRKEMAVKPSSQAFLDDFLAVSLQNGASSDDFSVDELFDFSNGDGFSDPPPEEDETVPVKAGLVSPFAVSPRKQNPQLSSQSPNFNFESGEFVVPTDEEKDLEWLSHLVEDSNSEYSTPFPAGAVLTEDSKPLPADPEKPPTTTCFKSPVPAKARSKRARAGGRFGFLTGTPSLSESSSSSTSSSSSCSPPSPWLIYATPSSGSISPLEPGSLENPLAKKQRKKPFTDSAGSGGAAQPHRRCSHCGVTKTPQWRAGPLGAKTLCNACGVRFKSGRLLPEYRPACSPTFSNEIHSNHHRKVLEMRRKKDVVVVGPVAEDDAGPAVPSF